MDITIKSYNNPVVPTWCPGCGDYGIWGAIKKALTDLQIAPTDVLLAFDVGCHGNMQDKIGGYRFGGLHGRVLPVAIGHYLANPKLHVIAIGGDGATFSEGTGHLIQSVRGNYDITFILHNNRNYGLTTGQPTATTPKGQPMNVSFQGVVEEQLNTLDFVFSLKPSFVARGFSSDISHMAEIIKAGINHKGFSYVEILQLCPSYNKFTDEAFYKQRIYKLDNTNHDASDLKKAREKAYEEPEKFALGVIYEDKNSLPYLERLSGRKGNTSRLIDEVDSRQVTDLLENFK
ncbi:MAG: thiamine pyrophosphate-dependent enzyme [bacterium]